MQVNLICCLYVLESEKNDNIRKNDIKRIKVLTTKEGMIPSTILNSSNMKNQIKENISSIIGSSVFHLEQVLAMNYENGVEVIYLGITNIENIVNLDENYQLTDFEVKDNSIICFGQNQYNYQTMEVEEDNNIEYMHVIDVEDKELKRNLLNLLVSYKRIRSNADNTDILFKFMGKYFTLEDVRIVYEMIKNVSVDKSNFRKRIMKYCEKVDEKEERGNGFRPSQKYKFKPLKGDIWI